MPSVAGMQGTFSWAIWDSITLGATDVTATLFTVPQGSSSKVRYNTNLPVAGQMPDGWNFDVKAFSWAITAGETHANAIAVAKGVWRLIVSDKVFQELPFFVTPGGAAVYPVPDAASAGTAVYGVIGEPMASNLLSQENPITIKPGEPFRLECEWPTAPNAKTFWFFMWGSLTRNVN